MKKAVSLTLTSAFLLWSALAYAHRFHAGITDISMNSNTGNTEIVHTFMAHDVESMLENRFQRQFDLSDTDDALLFQKYLEQQFFISDSQGTRLTIKWVGLKVDPSNVMVFQEIEKQALPAHGKIRLAALTDFLSDQVNTLNFNQPQGIQTQQFTRENREQAIP